jgi:hypothetical protein
LLRFVPWPCRSPIVKRHGRWRRDSMGGWHHVHRGVGERIPMSTECANIPGGEVRSGCHAQPPAGVERLECGADRRSRRGARRVEARAIAAILTGSERPSR